jgi:NADH:ubiquinone reductase (H+-translocating)
VVDLGDSEAVADPLHLPLTGPLAKIVTCGHHLLALLAGRPRIVLEWLAAAVAGRQIVQFGLVSQTAARLADADRIA